MRINLPFSITASLLGLILLVGVAPAQSVPRPLGTFQPAGAAANFPVDPTTGLPLPEGWISADWTDPDVTLTNVDFDGLPASEVARYLKDAFQNKFDILIPPGWTTPSGDNVDPGDWIIRLHVKNVAASEIFRAMNLLAENENAPFRWQLIINGKRPMVLLKVLPNLLPPNSHSVDAPAPNTPKQPMVCYVGDLIGDGGMTMQQIADTLADVNHKGYDGGIYIAFHEEAELIIVKGTDEQIGLVRNTLDALKQKMSYTLKKKYEQTAGQKPGNAGSK